MIRNILIEDPMISFRDNEESISRMVTPIDLQNISCTTRGKGSSCVCCLETVSVVVFQIPVNKIC